jgi:hypothetical protein
MGRFKTRRPELAVEAAPPMMQALGEKRALIPSRSARRSSWFKTNASVATAIRLPTGLLWHF